MSLERWLGEPTTVRFPRLWYFAAGFALGSAAITAYALGVR